MSRIMRQPLKRDDQSSVKEKVVLVVMCVIILLMFQSVIIYYYIKEYAIVNEEDFNNTLIIPNISYNFSPTVICNGSNTTEPITLCSLYGTAVSTGCSSDDCPINTYTGSVCRQSLSTWQSCALDGNHNTLHISTTDQATLESNAAAFVDYLVLANQECQQVALHLLCLYAFPLCNCTSQKMYTPTRETCLQVQGSTCSSEWNLVKQLRPELLPDCNLLPANSGTPSLAGVEMNCSNDTQQRQDIICRYDFIKQNETCWPRCDRWTQNPENIAPILRITSIVVSSLGTLVGVICLCFAIYEYKRLFRFPAIFLVFLLMDYIVLAICAIISFTASSELFCSDIRLDISRDSPTIYCTITGVIFQYIVLQMGCFFLCHLSFFFYNVVFPFHASQFKKKTKRRKCVYLFTVTICLLLPAIGVLVVLVTDKYRYVQNDFPAFVCTINDFTFSFYTYVVPINIMISIGLCLLVVSLWKIHKHQGIFREKNVTMPKHMRLTGPEKKILWFFLAFIFYGIVATLYPTIFGTYRKEFFTALEQYFACEALGHVPGKCSRDEVEKYSRPYLVMIVYISNCLIPLTSLVFVVNLNRLKNCCGNELITKNTRTKRFSISSMNNSHKSSLRTQKSHTFGNSTILSHKESNVLITIPEELENEAVINPVYEESEENPAPGENQKYYNENKELEKK